MSATDTTQTNSNPAAETTKVTATTTYRAFVLGEGGWEAVGQFEVGAGRSDVAKRVALEKLIERDPTLTEITVAVVPAKSWQPETFKLEAPKPRFVPAG